MKETNGITYLLEPARLDKFKKEEMELFDRLEIQNVPYFRDSFFRAAAAKAARLLARRAQGSGSMQIAEMGGGEGHWAAALKDEFPSAQVFVCDLSAKALARSRDDLKRICADITEAIFDKGSMGLVSFWVSLHHLSPKDRLSALKNAADSLEDGGVLLVFEPNDAFLPRRILYNTRLGKDVYPDEREEAINFSAVSEAMRGLGMAEEAVYFVNPPYNSGFVRKLKNWIVYMAAAEFLYRIERWIFDPLFGGLKSSAQAPFKRYLALYGLAVYRKGGRAAADRGCLLCGGGSTRKKGRIAAGYDLMECRQCGLQFIDPAPGEKRLKEIYDGYYSAWGKDESRRQAEAMKAKTFGGYLRALAPFASSGRLLDIGCATGEFLETARAAGFDVYGVEISAEGIESCRKRFGGDRIAAGDLRKGVFPQDFFDCITLFDVIEHIKEPSEFLGTVCGMLKPSGVLMMVTPDTSSWTNAVSGRRWPHYKEEHIYYYNRSNMKRLLSGHFDIMRIGAAKKTLSIDYVNNVLGAYSKNGLLKAAAGLLSRIAGRARFAHFEIGIGEMLVIARKRC